MTLKFKSAAVSPEFVTSSLKGLSIEARPYQSETVADALTHLMLSDAKSCLINSATGSGKTVMALAALRILSSLSKHPLRIGWSAMRRNLLAQAADENKSRGFGVELLPFSMFDQNPPENLDILIVDEAHHDATDSMANIHQKSKPKKVLGLSATPYRSDNAELAFEKVICKAGLWQLVREGYLALADHYTIASWTPEAVADVYIKNRQTFGKSAMFFVKYENCIEAQEHLRRSGVKSEIVTSTSDRYAQIDAFEAGELDVLINMAILTEGFDCPSLQTVFVRPTLESLTAQMCGRVLRKYADLRKNIVQSKCTPNPYDKYAPVHEQFVSTPDGWKSLQADRARIEKIAAGTAEKIREELNCNLDDAQNAAALSYLSGKFKFRRRGRGGRGAA